MTTFNSSKENLLFRCKSCDFKSGIEIDPTRDEDMLKLGKWLLQHSATGGDYICISARRLVDIHIHLLPTNEVCVDEKYSDGTLKTVNLTQEKKSPLEYLKEIKELSDFKSK